MSERDVIHELVDAFAQLARDILPAAQALAELGKRYPAPVRLNRMRYPELQALYAQGLSVRQIAVSLGTSRRQVYKHLTRALHG